MRTACIFAVALVFAAAVLLPAYGRQETADADRVFAEGVKYYREGNLNGARTCLELALDMYGKYPDTERDRASCHALLGDIVSALGEGDGGLSHYLAAVALFEKVPGAELLLAGTSMNAAITLSQQGAYGKALPLYERALAVFQKLPDTQNYRAECLSGIGMCLDGMERYGEAAGAFESALALLEAIPGTEHRRAVVRADAAAMYLMTDDPEKAQSYYERALEVFHRMAGLEREQAQCLKGLGNALAAQGMHDRALGAYGKALAILRRLKGTAMAQAECLSAMGIALGEGGKAELALNAFEECLALLKKIDNSAVNQARCLVNMAVSLNELGKTQEALATLVDAEELLKKANAKREIAECRVNKGEALRTLGRYEEAMAAFREALAVLETLPGTRRQQAGCRLNMGVAEKYAGRHREAIAHFEAALALFEKLPGSTGMCASALANVGDAKRLGGDLAGAERAFLASLQLGRDAWWARLGLARTYEKMGGDNAGRALDQFAAAISRIETKRRTFQAKDYTISWFEDKMKAYHGFIDCILSHRGASMASAAAKQWGATPEEMALSLSESCHARMLSDILSRQKPQVRDDRTRALVEQERELQAKVDRLFETRERLRGKGEDEKMRTVGAEIDEAMRRKNAVEGELNGTALAQIAGGSRIPDVKGMQALLDEGSAILEYLVMEEKTLLWVITKRSCAVHSIAVGSAAPKPYPPSGRQAQMAWLEDVQEAAEESPLSLGLEGMVHFYRFPMTNFALLARTALWPWQAHQAMGVALYRTLLPREAREQLRAAQVSHLVIVPDGILHALPFSSLIAVDEDASLEPDRSYDVRFLLEDYATSYLPSASILGTLRAQKAARDAVSPARRQLLAFADPVFDADDPRAGGGRVAAQGFLRGYYQDRFVLKRLPDTRDEAEGIAELFPPESRRVHLGFDASEEKVKSAECRDFRYILFATHGLMDEQNPWLSCLALSIAPPGPAQRQASPFLRLESIFGLDLNADLVVLSACETALGKISKGEGMMGMPVAFFYAGTPSLLATLWKVPSAPTARLSREFFTRLARGGLDKARALQQAQIALVKSGDSRASFAHPFFWSAFILDGDWR